MATLTTLRGRTLRRLAHHYLEMVVAMVVGMVVLGAAKSMLLDPVDWAELRALVMATNMTVAMGAWMRLRGHGWAAIAEMAVAMYGSFVVLFPPLWLGGALRHRAAGPRPRADAVGDGRRAAAAADQRPSVPGQGAQGNGARSASAQPARAWSAAGVTER